jgi:hypothetical protein
MNYILLPREVGFYPPHHQIRELVSAFSWAFPPFNGKPAREASISRGKSDFSWLEIYRSIMHKYERWRLPCVKILLSIYRPLLLPSHSTHVSSSFVGSSSKTWMMEAVTSKKKLRLRRFVFTLAFGFTE